MTNIIIELTAWYLRDNGLEEYDVYYEVDVPGKYGFKSSFKRLDDIARLVVYENENHRIINPVYKIILKEGSHPLRKVKKYSDYERYTAKPDKKVVEKLTALLRNRMMISGEEESNL